MATDTHYDRVDYPSRATVAQNIIDSFNAAGVSLVLGLGDMYDGNFTDLNDYLADKALYEVPWFSSLAPVHWAVGNHDNWGISTDNYIANNSFMTTKDYTVDLGDNWRVIIYSNVESWAATSDTLTWLQNSLEQARLDNKKIILAAHMPIYQDDLGCVNCVYSSNAAAQRSIIDAAKTSGANIKYVFAGHIHTNAHVTLNGIDYYVFKNGGDDNTAAIVTIKDDNSLEITGLGSQTSYNESWSQTDWSGGSGQTAWSDTSKFSSSSNLTTSTANIITLNPIEKFTNTGFETDLSNWTNTTPFAVDDEFSDTDPLVAGSVNGTSANPGPGTRTVTDTGSKISVGSGVLNITGGISQLGNPGIWYGSVTRGAGKILVGSFNFSGFGASSFGWDANQNNEINDNAFSIASGGTLKAIWNDAGRTIATLSTSTPYQLAVILRSTGAYYFVKGGAYSNWTLLYISSSLSNTVYPNIQAYSTAFAATVDYLRLPSTTWLPTPLVYDTFTRTDGAPGSSEANSPDGTTLPAHAAPQLSWTNQRGTSGVASSAIKTSATSNGSAISTVPAGADVIASIDLTRGTGIPGIVFRYQDANNYGYAIHNGTNVQLHKVVAGNDSTLIDTAATYGVGYKLTVITNRTAWRLYYNNAFITPEQTVSDTDLQSGTGVGWYTTDTDSTGDNLVIYARGTGGEYSLPTDSTSDLTTTRDISTKYAEVASAKLVGGINDNNFTQSVNLGDTNSYNISTYAYIDGGAISDGTSVQLVADGSPITTTYSSSGIAGWYSLTGTVTGASSAKNYGVIVKAGKTVYVDNISLNGYAPSGNLTSSIFDTGISHDWGLAHYVRNIPANTTQTVKIRTSNNSDMSGATDFATCNSIANNADISSNNCVSDGQRYVQYYLTLTSTNPTTTPNFTTFTLGFVPSNDSTAPTISSVVSTPTSSGSTIIWTTNEESSSRVDYGLTDSYGSNTTESDTQVRKTSHSVSISGLAACTTYHYRVRSKDYALNETIDSDNSFTTSGTCPTPDSVAPLQGSTTLPQGCSDVSPGSKAPWLYGAIAQDSNSVLLYFTPADNPVNKYVLEYGTKSGDYPYGVLDMGVNSRGSMTYLVKSLSPNTTYYFRVRGGNGCATGTWSNEISAKTKGLVSFNQLEIIQSQLEPQPVTETPNNTNCQTYTVESGDSLWSIASSLLGNGNKYQDIIEQNRDKYPSLETSNNLNTGWELKVNCGDNEQSVQGPASVPPADGTTAGKYDVKVKVADTNKKPIEGATVTIHSNPQTAKTDKDGVVLFHNVEQGEHKVLIAYSGYEGEQSVNLTGDVKEFVLNIQIKQTNAFLNPPVMIFAGITGIVILGLVILLIRAKRKE